MKPIAALSSLVLLLLTLTACGQKGPLYLPEDDVAQEADEQQQSPAE